MKKDISIIITISIVFTMFSLAFIKSYANENYDELFAQREKYLDEHFQGGNDGIWLGCPFIVEVDLTVLLYTDIAKSLTFKKTEFTDDVDGPLMLPSQKILFTNWYTFYLESPELYKAMQGALYKPYGDDFERAGSSLLRACIKYFDISREELEKANKKMMEDPDSIRDLLSCLSDVEFESARQDNGSFCTDPIPPYAMEALYLKDDVIANNLLCPRYSVYFGDELNRVVTEIELDYEKIAQCDLTPFWVGDYLNRYDDGSWVYDKLLAERERQLANPKTGEPVYLIPLAAISLTLAVYAVYPRKKRKLEA